MSNSVKRFGIPYEGQILEDFIISLDQETIQLIKAEAEIDVPSEIYLTCTWNTLPRMLAKIEYHPNKGCSIPEDYFKYDSLVETVMFLLFHQAYSPGEDPELEKILKAIAYVSTFRKHVDV